MRWILVAGVVLVSARIADASVWYYNWSCSGECAPGQLAISGREGPFASESDCESVRWSDSRRETFVAAGNLGGLEACAEYDVDPGGGSSSGPTRVAPFQRATFGVLAGDGWHVTDGMGAHAPDARTIGGEMNLVFSARPNFGLETSLGFQHISVNASVYGPDAKTMNIIPWYLGLTSTPRLGGGKSLDARLDLGADFGFLFRTGCDMCDADGMTGGGFTARLRAGLDLYFGRSKTGGIGFDVIYLWARYGDFYDQIAPTAIQLDAPKVMFRASLLLRSGSLNW